MDPIKYQALIKKSLTVLQVSHNPLDSPANLKRKLMFQTMSSHKKPCQPSSAIVVHECKSFIELETKKLEKHNLPPDFIKRETLARWEQFKKDFTQDDDMVLHTSVLSNTDIDYTKWQAVLKDASVTIFRHVSMIKPLPASVDETVKVGSDGKRPRHAPKELGRASAALVANNRDETAGGAAVEKAETLTKRFKKAGARLEKGSAPMPSSPKSSSKPHSLALTPSASADVTDLPTDATDLPADSPADAMELHATETPATNPPATEPPADATEPPADATDSPADATDPPADATDLPADATDLPAVATDLPTVANDLPADATDSQDVMEYLPDGPHDQNGKSLVHPFFVDIPSSASTGHASGPPVDATDLSADATGCLAPMLDGGVQTMPCGLDPPAGATNVPVDDATDDATDPPADATDLAADAIDDPAADATADPPADPTADSPADATADPPADATADPLADATADPSADPTDYSPTDTSAELAQADQVRDNAINTQTVTTASSLILLSTNSGSA